MEEIRNYRIRRECWNENTFNGYTDNPYWRVDWNIYKIGLMDSGEFWIINSKVDDSGILKMLQTALTDIVKQCNLKIEKVFHKKLV